MSRQYRILDQELPYFITCTTVYWLDVFTKVEYKDILLDSLSHCIKQKGLELFAFCIMTNHIHLIARGDDQNPLQHVIRDFKRFTSKSIIHAIEENPAESRKDWLLSLMKKAGKDNHNNQHYQFWQQHNHPIALDHNEMLDQKLDYVHRNPVEAGIVAEPYEFLYSSARQYAGYEPLLKVQMID